MSLEEIPYLILLGLLVNLNAIISLGILVFFILHSSLSKEEKTKLFEKTNKMKKNYYSLLYHLIPFWGLYLLIVFVFYFLKYKKHNHETIFNCIRDTDSITDIFKINK